MSVIKHVLALIILLILLGIVYGWRTTPTSPVPSNPDDGGAIACTEDAMMCPDGSYVGRSGPLCQFVCSPASATTSPSTSLYEKFTIGLNQAKVIGDTTITVFAVMDDSRCASDVTCVWAGQVIIAVKLTTPSGDSIKEMKPGETLTTETLAITLDEVNPYPVSTHKTTDAEYQFVMNVKGK